MRRLGPRGGRCFWFVSVREWLRPWSMDKTVLDDDTYVVVDISEDFFRGYYEMCHFPDCLLDI